MASGHFSATPFLSSGFFCLLHSGVNTPRSFSFPSSPSVHFFPSSSSLRGHSHKSFRKRPSRESLGISLLTDPLGNRFSRILWEIASHGSFGKSLLTNPWALYYHSGHGVLSPLFFEPSRASEARCRRQEPREGVPKRTGACERGGEARRREPWWEVNDHLPNNRCATPVGL